MKKILILSLAVALFGCKNSEKKAADSTAKETTATTKEFDGPVITFQKTPCYGTCPIYTADIYADGRMVFTGKRFVKLTGEHNLSIDQTFIKDILNEAESINFFEMQDRYDGNVTDLPSTITTITHKGKTKKVIARHNIPDELNQMNKYIHKKIMEQTESGSEKLMHNKNMVEQKKRSIELKPNTQYQK